MTTSCLLLILFVAIIGLMLASPCCMLKIDMAKAYDSVEWSFLMSVMQEMSFPTQFIDWVMCCVSSMSYSILINGLPGIPFRA